MIEPLKLYDCTVKNRWIDYNDHMTEASYLTAFGHATDAFFVYFGNDEMYRAKGHSFYTVETHINFYKEAKLAEPLTFTTQLLGMDRKRLHFFHSMFHRKSGQLLATTEQMLVHVDMKVSMVVEILPDVYTALKEIMALHKNLPIPKQVGRQMKIPNNG